MKKILLIIVLYAFANNTIAQTAPNLGTAKTFGLLSGSSITSTDTIVVRGNAGATTSVGSRIKATTIYTGGGTVSTAITDLGTAKSFCSGQSGTTISGTLNGQTLVAGVYTISGNATLTDSLTLTGDSNSVFIFNISGNISFDTLEHLSSCGNKYV